MKFRMNKMDRHEDDNGPPRLIVALDFGTTYTGVAYTISSGPICELDDISVVRNWGTEAGHQDKIPSATAYSLSTQAIQKQWESNASPDVVTFVHTKLELEVQDTLSELEMTLQMLDGLQDLNFADSITGNHSDNRQTYAHKSPEDIVTDFLTRVYRRVTHVIEEFLAFSRGQNPISFIITVPKDWSITPINSLFRAISKAGVNKTNLPNLAETLLLTEADARAHYIARLYKQVLKEEAFQMPVTQHKDRYIIICDAGGYKVNVAPYRIMARHPVRDLEQIGLSLVEDCGSQFIDRAFLKWLRETLGDNNYRELDPDLNCTDNELKSCEGSKMRYLMRQFNEQKRRFDDGSRFCYLDLPTPFEDLTIDGSIRFGRLKIPQQLMKGFFETIIPSILDTVHIVRKWLEKIGVMPEALFLVGGFGDSKYLQQQLEETLKFWPIRVCVPQNPWTSIVQGAVLCGVERDKVSSLRYLTPCRYSYAICLDDLFPNFVHVKGVLATIRPKTYAEPELFYMLDEGDVVFADEPRVSEQEFDISFPRSRSTVVSFPIYRYQGHNRPPRFNFQKYDLERACTLNIDLARVARHGEATSIWSRIPRSHRVTLKLTMVLDGDKLTASLKCKDTVLARADVDY